MPKPKRTPSPALLSPAAPLPPGRGDGAADPTPALLRRLAGGDPLSYRLYPDGRLVIIDPAGRKLTYPREQWAVPDA